MVDFMRKKWRALEPAQRRFYAVGLTALALVLASVLSIVLFHGKQEVDPNNPSGVTTQEVTLTSEERDALNTTVRKFMLADGTFGIKDSLVTPQSLLSVLAYSGSENTTSNYYFTSRQDAYSKVKTAYILPGGPLDYDGTTVANWSDDILTHGLVSFSLASLNVNLPQVKHVDAYQNNQKTYVVIPLTFTSEEKSFIQKADDASSDGTVNIMQREFNESATATLVWSNNKWQVESLTGPQDGFLLASANPPGDYSSTQYSLVQAGTMTPVKGR